MKLRAVVLIAAAGMASPEIRYFQYQRPVLGTIPGTALGTMLRTGNSQTCLTLDADVFAHAAPRQADLRLYRDSKETPYIVHLDAPVQAADTPVSPLNLGVRGQQTVFDAALPEGSYTDLDLGVVAQNFIATVKVSGSHTQTSGAETKLGSYTIFDLTREKLGRSTVLHLPDTDFRYLHFEIDGPIVPDNITGVTVVRLPTRKYQPVADSGKSTQQHRETVFAVTIPAHVPVDRLLFSPGPEPAIFSRDVSVSVAPVLERPPTDDAAEPRQPVRTSGNLLRLHTSEDGHRIDEERLTIDTPGMDFDTPTLWTISIQNGDDAPLPMGPVHFQMLQRELCFASAANAHYTLFYGDPELTAPRYDYAALFTPQTDAIEVSAGPEQRNALYQARPDERPFTEKHPALLWVALVGVIALLGGIAFRSTRTSTLPANRE